MIFICRLTSACGIRERINRSVAELAYAAVLEIAPSGNAGSNPV